MDEQNIISQAGTSFKKSRTATLVEKGANNECLKPAYFEGFKDGVVFYANRLYNKELLDMIQSISETADADNWIAVAPKDITIIKVLKDYKRMMLEKEKLRKSVKEYEEKAKKKLLQYEKAIENKDKQIEEFKQMLANLKSHSYE
jgi:hypothetical protein